MIRTPFDPPTVPAPTGGYTQALHVTEVSRWLFVSGQVPMSAGGSVPAEFGAQCTLVWQHVTASLAAARMDVRNLVKVTTFLSSREHAMENAAIRAEFLAGQRPALTVVIADIYDPDWLLEVEAIAAA
jgi:enamine deaminase RidA (YjgF/YER057c/UK114 family)